VGAFRLFACVAAPPRHARYHAMEDTVGRSTWTRRRSPPTSPPVIANYCRRWRYEASTILENPRLIEEGGASSAWRTSSGWGVRFNRDCAASLPQPDGSARRFQFTFYSRWGRYFRCAQNSPSSWTAVWPMYPARASVPRCWQLLQGTFLMRPRAAHIAPRMARLNEFCWSDPRRKICNGFYCISTNPAG